MLTVSQLTVHQQHGVQRQSSEEPATPTAVVDMWKDFKQLFQKKVLRIDSDSVGYGFVLRGDGPTYVQTVDPSGPSAKSGLKVGHIIHSVNGTEVIDFNHKDTAKVILGRRLSAINVTVLEQSPQ